MTKDWTDQLDREHVSLYAEDMALEDYQERLAIDAAMLEQYEPFGEFGSTGEPREEPEQEYEPGDPEGSWDECLHCGEPKAAHAGPGATCTFLCAVCGEFGCPGGPPGPEEPCEVCGGTGGTPGCGACGEEDSLPGVDR